MIKTIGLACLLLWALLACSNQAKPLTLAEWNARPEHQLANYTSCFSPDVSQRILTAPPLVVNYLNKMDGCSDYQAMIPDARVKAQFLDYFKLLPAQFQKLWRQKVAAVYFIDKFKGGGMTDYVFDSHGQIFMIMYFNPRILTDSLSTWINYRDNSAFVEDSSGIRLISDCGPNYLGLLHTLVHENSHMYDFYQHLTPYISDFLYSKPQQVAATPFTSGIWQSENIPLGRNDFPGRESVVSYGLGKTWQSASLCSSIVA